MIFLHQAKLLILSQTKTGSTALGNALRDRASFVIKGPAPLKHTTYEKFMEVVAPWIESQSGISRSQYEVVSVMREPIDWLGSWYRYRTRERRKGKRGGRYTGNVSFDEFVQEFCKEGKERASFARMNGPEAVARSGQSIGVDRLFPYEDLSGLYSLIEERTGVAVVTERRNVSPELPVTLSDPTKELVSARMSFAIELHSVLESSGDVPQRFRAPSTS